MRTLSWAFASLTQDPSQSQQMVYLKQFRKENYQTLAATKEYSLPVLPGFATGTPLALVSPAWQFLPRWVRLSLPQEAHFPLPCPHRPAVTHSCFSPTPLEMLWEGGLGDPIFLKPALSQACQPQPCRGWVWLCCLRVTFGALVQESGGSRSRERG